MYDLFTNVAGDMKLIFLKEIRLYTKIYVLNGGGGGGGRTGEIGKLEKR